MLPREFPFCDPAAGANAVRRTMRSTSSAKCARLCQLLAGTWGCPQLSAQVFVSVSMHGRRGTFIFVVLEFLFVFLFVFILELVVVC